MTRVITNKNNCGGKFLKQHTWSVYSYDQKCQVCGVEMTSEECGSNPAPLGTALVLLVILSFLI